MGDLPEITTHLKNINFVPSDIDIDRNVFTRLIYDNRFTNVIGILAGLTDNGIELLTATTGKVLRVANVGSGFEDYSVLSGNAPDSYDASHQLDISDKGKQWVIKVSTYDAVIRFRNKTDTGWLDDIELTQGWSVIDFTSKSIQIKNKTAGQTAVYQIVGMY